MSKTLRPPKAPNLPIGPVAYEQNYQNQLNNAQRLYYNQIDNTLTVLMENNGGRYLNFPYISASDSTNQYATTNTPTLAAWNTDEGTSGFTLGATSAVAQYDGVYRIDYSLQFINTDNAAHDVTVWLRINGSDLARSASIFTVPARKSAGVYGYLIAVSFVQFAITSGDTIQLYWATDQAYNTVGPVNGVYMYASPAQTSPFAAPASPSAIGTITFVSELAE